MKGFLFMPLLVLSGFVPGKTPLFLNPTGTYILKGAVKHNRVTGHSGELRVRLLDEHTVALCLFINTGYPGYKSGSLLDTLNYEDSTARYQPQQDTTCDVYFFFGARNVKIVKVMSDPHSGCGFAPGVLVPVTIPKVSSEIPVIMSLAGRGA